LVIVETERTLALLCPACQGTQFHEFSIFGIGHKPYPLQCRCGFAHGQVQRTGSRYTINAFSLTGEHVCLAFPAKEFLRAPLVVLIEPTFGDNIGFLGRGRDVQEAVANSDALSQSSGDALDVEDFENPDVMYAVLARLQQLAGEGKITCRCDHPSVGIDIYPEKVELVCSFCGSAVVIGASAPYHQERVAHLSEIVMEPSSYAYLSERLKPLI
jgi:uncharacterized Zn-finger protein